MPDGATSQLSPEAIAAEYRGRPVDVFSCVSRGWNLVLESPGPLVGGTLLILCTFIVLQFVPLFGQLAAIVLQGPLFAGLYQVFIRRIRGESVSVLDAFTAVGDANFVQLFLAGFISSLLTMIGFLLCVLPGIFLAICYLFVLPLAFDRKLDFWLAMEVSRRVIQPQWLTFFGLALVCFLAVVAGTLACLVGLIVAFPVCFAAVAYAYEDVFGRR